MSDCFEKGLYEQKPNEKKALYYRDHAVSYKHLPSARYLYRFHLSKKNYPMVIRYAKKAQALNDGQLLKEIEQRAKDGDLELQYQLGCFYQKSNQKEEALPWFVMAVCQGHSQAKSHIEKAKFDGETLYELAQQFEREPNGEAMADYCYQKSAKKGYVYASTDIALRSNAFDDYLYAARCGNKQAEEAMERLAEEGDPTLAKKLATYYKTRDSYLFKMWQAQSKELPFKPDKIHEHPLNFITDLLTLDKE